MRRPALAVLPDGAPPFDTRYELPPIDKAPESPAAIAELRERVRELARARGALILAHNYQRPEVQDAADIVGDSLELSRHAAASRAEVIVFCGVHFMAETAALLDPARRVLLPDLRARCSLAASINADELRQLKARHPDAAVVSYINTSAAVKALSDVCCTSANAARVIASIPAKRPVLFLPDQYLAAVVAAETQRDNIIAYPGYCHVHRVIDPEDVLLVMAEHPSIELLLHPECGCVSSCMQRVVEGELPQERTYFLSTSGMSRHVQSSPCRDFAVGTELGMLHPLRRAHPDRRFIAVNEQAVCAFMKTITLSGVARALETLSPRVVVDDEVAAPARRAIERMLAL